LSAVSKYAGQVTAVVSGADDGGSSGRLRASWAGPAPGDVRRCLLALAGAAPDEQAWAKALDYRFSGGELDGHSLGNLVLVALSETTGDFAAAVAHVARLLGARAKVLPATSVAVVLCAELDEPDGGGGEVRLVGQVKVAHSPGRLRRVWVEPPSPPVPEAVLEAIATADQVVIGPGSLFTSVLAVCAVPGIREALAARSGGRVYVCNVGLQIGETGGFDADDHLAALIDHGVVVDAVVCDPASLVGSLSNRAAGATRATPAAGAVRATPAAGAIRAAGAAGATRATPAAGATRAAGAAGAAGGSGGVQVATADLVAADGHSHDPCRLAPVLERLAAQ
jgi:uncharacterized cofD-like protein